MKPRSYSQSLAWVSSAHIALIGGLFGLTVVHGCMSPPPDTKGPMELIVEVPSDIYEVSPVAAPPAPAPEPEKAVQPEIKDDDFAIVEPPKPKPVKPKETAQPDNKPKPDPKKQANQQTPNNTKVAPDRRLIVRHVKPTSNRKTQLTAAEIARLLDHGAKPGSTSTLSDKQLRELAKTDIQYGHGDPVTMDAAYYELIRQTLYRVWNQPSSIGVAGLVTRVELAMSPDGSITDSRIINGSGNPVMDASVVKALRSIRRVSGVPPAFLSAHRRITVAFELTGDG